MMRLAFYDPATGVFNGGAMEGPGLTAEAVTPPGLAAWPYDVTPPDPARWRVEGGELVSYQPPAPAATADVQWRWDATAWRWVPGPTLAAAQVARCAEVTAMRDALYVQPIAYGAALFDADPQSIDNMRGMVARIERGDGLTTGWVGWRTFDNAMVWADATAAEVLEHLNAIARALEDRQQAVLAASWAHKAAIRALGTVEAVQGYAINSGWPA